MEAIKEAWDFFQSEILGMGWLDRLVGAMLNALGLRSEEHTSELRHTS